MIFVPILIGMGIAALAGTGVATGASGISKLKKAKKIAEEAKQCHQYAKNRMNKRRREVNLNAEEFGKLKVNIRRTTFSRILKILKKLNKCADQKALEDVLGINVSIARIKQELNQQVVDSDALLKAGGAVLTGVSAGIGTYAAVGLLGTASTGTAISGLSGIAAHNATLAFLGGGSLAAGGGGMALGTAILGGIYVAPVLCITGLVLSSKGEKALTQAKEYKSSIDVQIEKINSLEKFLLRLTSRIRELNELAIELNKRAISAIKALENEKCDPNRRSFLERFRKAMLLVTALSEVMKVPILTEKGSRISIQSGKVLIRYRNMEV